MTNFAERVQTLQHVPAAAQHEPTHQQLPLYEMQQIRDIRSSAESIGSLAVADHDESLAIAMWAHAELGSRSLRMPYKYTQEDFFRETFVIDVIPGQPWVARATARVLALNPKVDTDRTK